MIIHRVSNRTRTIIHRVSKGPGCLSIRVSKEPGWSFIEFLKGPVVPPRGDYSLERVNWPSPTGTTTHTELQSSPVVARLRAMRQAGKERNQRAGLRLNELAVKNSSSPPDYTHCDCDQTPVALEMKSLCMQTLRIKLN